MSRFFTDPECRACRADRDELRRVLWDLLETHRHDKLEALRRNETPDPQEERLWDRARAAYHRTL